MADQLTVTTERIDDVVLLAHDDTNGFTRSAQQTSSPPLETGRLRLGVSDCDLAFLHSF